MEQEIQITERNTEKGTYYNIDPKDLKDGNHITLEKGLFLEGNPINGTYGISYSCKSMYKEQLVSFWLDIVNHDIFKTIAEGEKYELHCELVEKAKPKGTFFKRITVKKIV